MPTYIVSYTINACEEGVKATEQQLKNARERRQKMNDVMKSMGATKRGEQTTWSLSSSVQKAADVWKNIIAAAKEAGNQFLKYDWIGVYEISNSNTHEG